MKLLKRIGIQGTDKRGDIQATNVQRPKIANIELDVNRLYANCDLKVIRRPENKGLVSAVLEGIRSGDKVNFWF